MKHFARWKKTLVISCLSAVFCAGMWNQSLVTAWAAPSAGTVNTDNVRARVEPVDGNLAGSLTSGQRVEITDETQASDGYTWYKVKFGPAGSEITGWVRSDLLTVSDTDAADHGTDTGNETTAEGTFIIDGSGYDIADTIPSDAIPEGFTETTYVYGTHEVPALKDANDAVTLFYLTNTQNSSDKRFCVYDEERDEAVPFINVKMQNGFIVLMNVPQSEEAKISDRYTQTRCQFESGSVMSYQLTEPDDTIAENADMSDIYYLYGVNENGEKNWYVYDSTYNSIQRNVTNLYYEVPDETAAESDTSEQESAAQNEAQDIFDFGSSLNRMIVAGLGVLCLLLLILTIVFAVRSRSARRAAWDEPDEYQKMARDVKEKNKNLEADAREKRKKAENAKRQMRRREQEPADPEAERRIREDKKRAERRSMLDENALEAERRRTLEEQRQNEERQKALEAERQKALEERRQKALEERRGKALEEQRQKALEERRQKALEEQRRKALEERRKKALEEQRQKAAEEERRLAEERRQKAAEEERRLEEERRQKAAEEQRLAEEQRQKAAEEQRLAEEQRQKAAEEQRLAEEQRQKAMEEQRRKAAEEQHIRELDEKRMAKKAGAAVELMDLEDLDDADVPEEADQNPADPLQSVFETTNLEAMINEIVAAEEAKAAEELSGNIPEQKPAEQKPVKQKPAEIELDNFDPLHNKPDRILREADMDETDASKTERDIEDILKNGLDM